MQLTRFKVHGYKNLTAPIELTDMGPVVVIHGPNNVGKSNLLEAMDLAFALMASTRGRSFPTTPQDLAGSAVERHFPPREVFSFGSKPEIRLEAVFALDDGGEVDAAMKVAWDHDKVVWHVERFVLPDGTDAGAESGGGQSGVAHTLAQQIGERPVPGRGPVPRFRVLHAARSWGAGPRDLVDSDALLMVYDAQEAPEFEDRSMWTVFEGALRQFDDVLGTDRFRVNYQRKGGPDGTGQASMVFEYPGKLVPLRLMGTGVQQCVHLFASLATAGADVLAIEEPEENLSFALQARLRRVLAHLTNDSRPPYQLLLTSHSPGMDISGEDFWNMQPGPSGPTMIRRDASLAPRATQTEALDPPHGTGPVSYVTGEGIVRLPDFVRSGLGVERGGGVVWLDAKDGFRVVTNDQALREAGLADDDGA